MKPTTNAGNETGLPMMHVSLDTADLPRAIEFYRHVFGVEPKKSRHDWAKFELAVPGLVFSLNAVPSPLPAGRLSHLGMRLPSKASLQALKERLQQEGVVVQEETQANCCYALQDKIWLQDPDGNAFEFYVLLADVESPDAGMGSAGQRPENMASCCVPEAVTTDVAAKAGSCGPSCC